MNKLFLKIFLIYISSIGSSYAFDYDPLLIRAQASIFPKIVLLDKDLDKKVMENKVVISILYGSGELKVAQEIKSLIENQYKRNLGKSSLQINVVEYEKFDDNTISTAYFILKGAALYRDKVTAHAASKKRLVFSYDYKDFENNALVSVLVREKTYIYLNKKAIHDYDIKFLPLFYKIVKVIE